MPNWVKQVVADGKEACKEADRLLLEWEGIEAMCRGVPLDCYGNFKEQWGEEQQR